MRKSLLIPVLACVLIFSILLTACGLFGGGGGGGGGKTTSDPWYVQGYTKGTLDESDAVNDFLSAVLINTFSPFFEGSPIKEASLSAELDLNLNGVSMDVALKSNYSETSLTRNALSMEVKAGSGNEVDLAVYQTVNNDGAELFLKFMNTKIKVPLQSQEGLFPMQSFAIDSQMINSISSAVKVQTIKYQYKIDQYNRYTRHYYLEIDFKKTITDITAAALIYAVSTGGSTADIDEFVFNLLGVSTSDIANGRFPDGSLILDFKTDLGTQNLGNGILSYLKLNLNVFSSLNKNTVFKGEAFKLDLTLKNLDIKTGANPFLNIQVPNANSYTNYNQTSFLLTLPMQYAAGNNTLYNLLLGVTYAEAFESIEIFVTPKNGEENLVSFEFDWANAQLRFNGGQSGKSFNFNPADFADYIANEVDAVDKNKPITPQRIIIYLLGALKFEDENTISFTFNEQKTFELLGVDADTILEAITAASGYIGSAEFLKFLDVEQQEFKNLFKEFVITINFSEEFIVAS